MLSATCSGASATIGGESNGMSEELAIARCQDGDRDAFRYLVERYKDVLFGTACLMTGSRTHAEDHVQEALLSAWRGIRGFRKGRPFKPWLVRILVNQVLSQRRRAWLPTRSLEEGDPRGESADPAETAAVQDDRRAVRMALAGLTAEHRQVVVLRYFAELTVAEVAQSLDVKEGTVKSRLHRALGSLEEQLGRLGYGREVENNVD